MLAGCGSEEKAPEHSVIPNPNFFELTPGDTFRLGDETLITFDGGAEEAERIGRFLADLIGNTVESMPEVTAVEGASTEGSIYLTLEDSPPSLGAEGYEMTVASMGVTIRAAAPAGLFYGVQTLRQLLPPVVEYEAAYPRPLFVPGGVVVAKKYRT